MSYPKVSLINTQSLKLISDFTNRKYIIKVGLPLSYSKKKNRNWPVIYLLDGNLYFGMVLETVRSMSWSAKTSDAIVVGISYEIHTSGEKAFTDIMARRSYDLTPVRDDDEEEILKDWLKRTVRTGGGAKFFKFISKELLPKISSNYRVNKDKTVLMGHSYGGIFTLYSMLLKPNLFKTYISISPPTYLTDKFIFDFENQYSKRRTTLPCRLILGIGEHERPYSLGGLSGMYRFADQIENHNYKWLDLDTFILPKEDHCSCIPIAFQKGLRKALEIN